MDEYAAVVRKFYEVYRPIGRNMWRQECGEYIVTNEHAERLRRKLKLITGGHTS